MKQQLKKKYGLSETEVSIIDGLEAEIPLAKTVGQQRLLRGRVKQIKDLARQRRRHEKEVDYFLAEESVRRAIYSRYLLTATRRQMNLAHADGSQQTLTRTEIIAYVNQAT